MYGLKNNRQWVDGPKYQELAKLTAKQIQTTKRKTIATTRATKPKRQENRETQHLVP
jgi:hypothetical protein